MTEIYTVLKPLPVGTTTLPSGSVVDAGRWRNLGKLITQRYLRPATAAEAATIGVEKPAKSKGTKQNGN